MMREQAEKRLQELKAELEVGQARLQEIERQRLYLQETMLRISGAITALEELLQTADAAITNATAKVDEGSNGS
jgi:predicted nuclease with TOPRIM domain